MVGVSSEVVWCRGWALALARIVAVVWVATACSASSESEPFGKGGGGGTKGDAQADGPGGTGGASGDGGTAGTAGTGGAAGWPGTGGTSGTIGDGGPSDVSQPQDGGPEAGDAADDVCFLKTCTPDGRQVLDCNGAVEETCGETELCQNGSCVDACHYVENDKSSVGCNYVAIDMDEHHGGSCFVAMVANTWPFNAHLQVRRWNGSQMVDLPVESFTRLPQGSGTVTYDPYVAATGIEPGKVALLFLSGPASGGVACPAGITPAVPGSAVLTGTGTGDGFEIQTDVPIVAYQMNPYGGGSAAVTGASLLLPNSAWGEAYIAMNAYSSATGIGKYASLNVVAHDDDTVVTFLPVAAVQGGGAVPASAAGTPFQVTLRRAQYLQISQAAELTGSVVTASRPVGFFAGHQCAQIPVGASYCDHTEQSIPPVRAFGYEYAAVQHKPRGAVDPTRWRVVAAADGTTLTFDPPGVHAPISLDLGGWSEITSQTPFVVRSQDNAHPFLVTAHMTGSSQVGSPSATDPGDPDTVLIIPPPQYMKRYVFLSDATYPTTNLVVVRQKRPDGTYPDVNLDCAGVLGGWTDVDSAGQYQYTRQDLSTGNFQPVGSCNNGVHTMESDEPFGLWVWAWGDGSTGMSPFSANVSYGYPAGANVTTLNAVMP